VGGAVVRRTGLKEEEEGREARACRAASRSACASRSIAVRPCPPICVLSSLLTCALLTHVLSAYLCSRACMCGCGCAWGGGTQREDPSCAWRTCPIYKKSAPRTWTPSCPSRPSVRSPNAARTRGTRSHTRRVASGVVSSVFVCTQLLLVRRGSTLVQCKQSCSCSANRAVPCLQCKQSCPMLPPCPLRISPCRSAACMSAMPRMS